MLNRHPSIRFNSICEIGCGAGGILAELYGRLPDHIRFTGYEISPQAHRISEKFASERCTYVLGDAFDADSSYDLVLIMDVVEHVEDVFSFMRRTKNKGHIKLFNIPLEAHVSAILRGANAWDSVGHIHQFTMETALKSVTHSGHKVIDWTLLGGVLAKQDMPIRTRLGNLLRLPLARLSPKLTARLLGGYSILILTE